VQFGVVFCTCIIGFIAVSEARVLIFPGKGEFIIGSRFVGLFFGLLGATHVRKVISLEFLIVVRSCIVLL